MVNVIATAMAAVSVLALWTVMAEERERGVPLWFTTLSAVSVLTSILLGIWL